MTTIPQTKSPRPPADAAAHLRAAEFAAGEAQARFAASVDASRSVRFADLRLRPALRARADDLLRLARARWEDAERWRKRAADLDDEEFIAASDAELHRLRCEADELATLDTEDL